VRRAIAAALALTTLAGCNAVVRSGPLSSRPLAAPGIYLSTGGADRPYRTLGFVQVRGYGVEVAGYADVGDAQLDGTIRSTLAQEAARLGGQGVLHIEFLDENPSTDLERAQSAANSVTNLLNGKSVETKDRYVTVSGELVQFL
jgi:hypothetical protein